MITIKDVDGGKLFSSKTAADMRAALEEAVAQQVYLWQANLAGLDLSELNLAGAEMQGVNLRGSTLIKTNLTGANLAGKSNLVGAYMEGVLLGRARLTGADFTGAWLAKARMQGVTAAYGIWCDAYLGYTDLSGATFENSDCRRVDFRGALLRNTSFLRTNLENAYFWEADLRDTDFRQANLLHAEFSLTDRSAAQINRRWVFRAETVIDDLSPNGEDL